VVSGRILRWSSRQSNKQERPNPTYHHQLVVRTLSRRSTRGYLSLGLVTLPCAVGRSGSAVIKREGDGASPIGTWPLRAALYRSDRLMRPQTRLPIKSISRRDGWCDAASDRNYNRPVTHPYPASAEHLWREDGLYDVIVVMGYNDRPRVKGKGSAIFLHCARADFKPTEGCIAVRRADLIRLLPRLGLKTRLRII
jgi:L,D-peptidoglycan transpeptidase YkuD (ErfK/YbiS/YcfS/YnhG family)